MLLRFRNDQANRGIVPLHIVLCAGLFPALAFAQSSGGDGPPTPAGSAEMALYTSPTVSFSSTISRFVPELNRVTTPVLHTDDSRAR